MHRTAGAARLSALSLCCLSALSLCCLSAYRLDVAVKNPVAVHVVHRLGQRVHEAPYARLTEIVPPATDQLVDVHLHELKNERQPPRRLVVEHLDQLDDIRVRRQSAQRLDLSKVVDLIDAVEAVLHAFDGGEAVALDALRLQHLGEGALPLLRHQPVLLHGRPSS